MARFTRTDLDATIAQVNDKLLRMGSPYHYKTERRNDYIAVDLYKAESCCHAVAVGSPKDCMAGLHIDAFARLYEAACDTMREMAGEFTANA